MPQPPGTSSGSACGLRPAAGGRVERRTAIAQFDDEVVAGVFDGNLERLLRVPLQGMVHDVAAAFFQRQREAEDGFFGHALRLRERSNVSTARMTSSGVACSSKIMRRRPFPKRPYPPRPL